MFVFAYILFFALSRSELLERLRAEPITKGSGLVQVWADCSAKNRREYQMPVAGFISDTCRKLYRANKLEPKRFLEPGIVVHIGEDKANLTNVIERVDFRNDGTKFYRINLPSPNATDKNALRLATVKAFYLIVLGVELDDVGAMAALRATIPELRIADEYATLQAWRTGDTKVTDEEGLRLLRTVIAPGSVNRSDVLVFASHLYLYPPCLDLLFCGKYTGCSFAEAIDYAQIDPCVRFVAFAKIKEVLIYGGGRSDGLSEAAHSYVKFLRELSRGEADADELRELLKAADDKLKAVLK